MPDAVASAQPSTDTDAASEQSDSAIDLFMPYTQSALDRAGAAAALAADLALEVATVNTALDGNALPTRVRLLGTQKTSYTAAGDLSKDLVWLRWAHCSCTSSDTPLAAIMREGILVWAPALSTIHATEEHMRLPSMSIHGGRHEGS